MERRHLSEHIYQRKKLKIIGLGSADFFIDLYPQPSTTEELAELADHEPALLLHMRVAVIDPEGHRRWISKGNLSTLLCHGLTTQDGHITRNGMVETRLIYSALSQYLREHNLPHVKLFVSCDLEGDKRRVQRWDQLLDNPVLGVSNSNVAWNIEANNDAGRTLILNLASVIPGKDPFNDFQHPKHEKVYEYFIHNLKKTS